MDAAPPGAVIGVATEIHLVKRLDDEHPDKTVVWLDPLVCPCSTMFRIDAPHLAWVLEELVAGRVLNRITVDDETAGGPGWRSSACSTSPDPATAGSGRVRRVRTGSARPSVRGPPAGGAQRARTGASTSPV